MVTLRRASGENGFLKKKKIGTQAPCRYTQYTSPEEVWEPAGPSVYRVFQLLSPEGLCQLVNLAQMNY